MPRGVGLDREKVIDGAAALVDAEGLDALTLSHLADRLGIRPPSLFKHVDGLPDLRASLAVRSGEALDATLAEAGADLVALTRAWRAWGLSHPGLYTLVSRTEVHSDAQRAAREVIIQRILAAVGRHTGEGIPAIHATRALRALVHGFLMIELDGGFGLDVAVEDSFDRGVQALLAGWPAR